MTQSILVVDDEEGIRRFLSEALRTEGYEVFTAADGREAVRRAQRERPDLIVMDVYMPAMDGLEATRVLKNLDDPIRGIPVLVLTGGATRDNVIAAQAAGADGFVVKPNLRIPVLLERIRRLLPRPPASEAAPSPARKAEAIREKIERKLQKVAELKALPPVVAEIVELTANVQTDARVLTGTIERDPSLTARVLRMANSSFYMRLGRTQNLTQAVSVIGYRSVRQMALSASLVEAYRRSGGAPGLDRIAFWKHSIGCGVLARDLALAAGETSDGAEDAFLAGLLHDLGKAFLDDHLREPYSEVIAVAAREGRPLVAVEQEILGIDHAEIAKRIMAQWKFPETLIFPVAHHHITAEALVAARAEDRKLLGFVHISNILTEAMRIGASGNETLDRIPDAWVSATGLTVPMIDGALRELEQKVEELTQILVLHDVGEAVRQGQVRRTSGQGKGGEVLLVRETPSFVDPLALLLGQWGFRVREAPLGERRESEVVVVTATSGSWFEGMAARIRGLASGVRAICVTEVPPSQSTREVLRNLGAAILSWPVPIREAMKALGVAV